MLKVTLIFSLFFLGGCRSHNDADDFYKFERELNKDAEKRIDAAYLEVTRECDSLFINELPKKVDSILKTDTLP